MRGCSLLASTANAASGAACSSTVGSATVASFEAVVLVLRFFCGRVGAISAIV